MCQNCFCCSCSCSRCSPDSDSEEDRRLLEDSSSSSDFADEEPSTTPPTSADEKTSSTPPTSADEKTLSTAPTSAAYDKLFEDSADDFEDCTLEKEVGMMYEDLPSSIQQAGDSLSSSPDMSLVSASTNTSTSASSASINSSASTNSSSSTSINSSASTNSTSISFSQLSFPRTSVRREANPDTSDVELETPSGSCRTSPLTPSHHQEDAADDVVHDDHLSGGL